MADFINVGFGNMVNGDKIISMVSTDAAPIKRMIQNARDEGKAVDATCGRRHGKRTSYFICPHDRYIIFEMP